MEGRCFCCNEEIDVDGEVLCFDCLQKEVCPVCGDWVSPQELEDSEGKCRSCFEMSL